MQSLRENIVESYTGIVFGVKEANEPVLFYAYVGGVFEYLSHLCSGDLSNNMDLVKGVAGLIGDIADLYGKKVQSYLTLPFVQKVIRMLGESRTKDHSDAANWANAAITKALK